ncbi:MAG: formylglycine-generating enzyme family protein [Saprospiraceae bacterium]|nr:formylglycine-generating enzyme family protein [Saprospiraceae bacterium]
MYKQFLLYLFFLAILGVECHLVKEKNPVADNHSQPKMPEGAIEDPIIGILLLVKAGTFQIGKYDRKEGHLVYVDDYYIGQTEVTQAQWEAVMGNNPSFFKNCPECPVENISWDETQIFITKLNKMHKGNNYRLPTDAEWAFAGLGGNRSKGYTYAGGDELDQVAWNNNNSYNKTHPVKGKSPNELGLYDMSGNVWEFCSDWFGNYEDKFQANPKGPETGVYHVIRGGSYGDDRACATEYLVPVKPDTRFKFLGFRLASDVKH